MKKKSFIIHKDSLSILDDLTDEQAGKLFKAIKSIQLDEVMELDPITKIALNPFKNQFDRDNDKYVTIVERNRINGAAGGRPKQNPEEPKKPSGLNGNQKNPTKPDSDSDSDSKNDSKSKKGNHLFKNSPYFDFEYLKANISDEYKKYDLKYYYENAKLYSESKGAKYLDWRATIYNWIRRDKTEGKAKLSKPIIKLAM